MDQQQLQPSTTSPLDWIACSNCHSSSHSMSSPLWLTTCTHAICSTCLFPAPSAPPPPADQAATATCPTCGVEGAVISLESALQHPDFAHCFKPLGTLVQELSMAAEWQMSKLGDEVRYFKAKCAEQKRTLGRVAGEVKQLKGVRSQAEQLAAENAFLRSQLAAAQSHHAASSSTAQQQQQQENAYFPVDGGSRGTKRKAGRSPDRHALPLQPAAAARAPSRSASAAALMNLPLPPTRLSFTPAQSKMAQERGRASSRQGVGGGGSNGAQGGESVKERLAQFAYNPSRAQQRPSVAPTPRPGHAYSDPAAIPPPSRASSRLQLHHQQQYSNLQPQPHQQQKQHFRLDQQFPPRSSPGSYNPPSIENVPHHAPPGQQQQHQRPPSRFDYQQPEEQLMPPPPVPTGSRRTQQQQQGGGGSSQFITARQLQHDQQRQAQYAQQPGTPAPRPGTYTPAPFAHLPLPPAPSSTPFGTSAGASHRKPFCPAGGGGGGGGGVEGGEGFRYG